MKPVLFPASQTVFNTNGIGRLPDAISCTVTEERNGQYELHMEYPIDGQLIEEITYNRILFAVPADGNDPQPFRIYRISKPLSGRVEIDAEHISYQLSHIPVLPFRAEGMTPAFEGLITYSAESNPFTFTREGQFGTALTNTFTVSEPDNIRSLLFGQAGSIIETFGGEWEFDKFNVILHKARGADNGVTIRYGKNLTDLKQEENIQSTYTGICPYWKGQDENGNDIVVSLPEKVLHSSSASNYPYQRTKVVDFSTEFQSEPTVAELRAKGQSYIESNDVGTPTVSLDVSFIALHHTQEYADMTRVYHVNLCDTVTVVFPALNVSTKAKVVRTVYNVLLDRYDSITIGAIHSHLYATLADSQEKAVEKAVSQSASAASTEYATKTSVSALSSAIGQTQVTVSHLTHVEKAFNGVTGGYVILTMDANEQSDCLYVLIDSPVLSAATKVFRWDENGLMYTTGGISNGTWTTVIDANGKVNASSLTGILADATSKNSWNLITGAMNLSNDTTFGGQTLSAKVNSLIPNISSAIQSALSTYDSSLDQDELLDRLTDSGNDTGFYLGQDGLLHMLTDRVITDGANIPVVYLPTVISNGEVTAYVQARVVNGVIYPPIQQQQEEEE